MRPNTPKNAQANKLEFRDSHGVRTESHQSHFERFKDAFVKELQDFTDSVLDDTRTFANSSSVFPGLKSSSPG